MNLELILTNENDLPEIAKLAHITWNEYYPAIVGQKQVDYMLASLYSNQAMKSQVEKEGQQFYFIQLEGTRIGFLSISIKQELLFIHKFYILSQNQKSGLGTKIMELIIKLFPQAKLFRLTVNRQNFKSINFYFKNGFIIKEVADFDIGNGYFMNDFVMEKQML